MIWNAYSIKEMHFVLSKLSSYVKKSYNKNIVIMNKFQNCSSWRIKWSCVRLVSSYWFAERSSIADAEENKELTKVSCFVPLSLYFLKAILASSYGAGLKVNWQSNWSFTEGRARFFQIFQWVGRLLASLLHVPCLGPFYSMSIRCFMSIFFSKA